MDFRSFEIDGPLEITPGKIEDERGYFSEIFRLNSFAERAGRVEFVQDNQSLSVRVGTIRGLHFQTHPAAQGKLVRCLAGPAVRRRGRPSARIPRPSAAGSRWSSRPIAATNYGSRPGSRMDSAPWSRTRSSATA